MSSVVFALLPMSIPYLKPQNEGHLSNFYAEPVCWPLSVSLTCGTHKITLPIIDIWSILFFGCGNYGDHRHYNVGVNFEFKITMLPVEKEQCANSTFVDL